MDPEENQDLQHEASAQRDAERAAAAERWDTGRHTRASAPPGFGNVVEAVQDLAFPMRRDEIRDAVGHRPVSISERGLFPLSTVLDKLPDERFDSVREFERAVERHWEGIRQLDAPPEEKPR